MSTIIVNPKEQGRRELEEEILSCKHCGLHQTRHHVLTGQGGSTSPIFIVGEAPGADEDRCGIPFVGKSGQLLDKILAACGFTREKHVFISNIVRCRPPGNRVPTPEEIRQCLPFLLRQIELINPTFIVTLGATAAKELLQDTNIRITRDHGKWKKWQNRLVMPLYHPAALLRNPALKKPTWDDVKTLVLEYRKRIDPTHHSDYI